MRKLFICAVAVAFSGLANATALQWADLSKDIMFDQISNVEQNHQIYVPNYSNLNFKITPYDYGLYVHDDTSTAGLEFTMRVESKTESYLYESDFKVDVLLGYVTVDAANSLVKFDKVYVRKLEPLNEMTLRTNIDEYLVNKLLSKHVLHYMDSVELPIDWMSLQNMRQSSQHVTRLNKQKDLVLEYY